MNWPGWYRNGTGAAPARDDTRLMAGLRSRLIVMLLLPLSALLGVNAWFDFKAASSASALQDANLLRLAPLLADSVVDEGKTGDDPPVILLTPAVEDFIKEREGQAQWGIATLDGRVVIGESWLAQPPPSTPEPEFHSEQANGVLYRVMVQRASTRAGDFLVLLADGSDTRQNWLRSLLRNVLLPNGVLILAMVFAVSWAVARALKPLTEITKAVERRSARDLSQLDASHSPQEIRPLVESLNRLFALVNEQSEAQRRFVADAAHQLRTPLAGLQAQVEAWVQSATAEPINIYDGSATVVSDDTVRRAITLSADELLALRDATRRTSQLAAQLLALSRADAQRLGSTHMQSVDLVQLCGDVLQGHIDHATRCGIDLGMDVGSNTVLVARGHDWLLRELLSNLCDNAIRYTAASQPSGHGQVTLFARTQGKALVLGVIDNGPGIAPEYRASVLQRFYRIPGTHGHGHGLGLAIAHEIATLHESALMMQTAHPEAQPSGRGLQVSLALWPSAS